MTDPTAQVLADVETVAARHGLVAHRDPATPFTTDWPGVLKLTHPDDRGRPGWAVTRNHLGRQQIKISHRGWQWKQTSLGGEPAFTLDWPIRCLARLLEADVTPRSSTSLPGVWRRLALDGYCTPCIHDAVLGYVARVGLDPVQAPHMTAYLLDRLDSRRCQCGPRP